MTGININDPIGLHVRKDFAYLRTHANIGDSIEAIRKLPPEGGIIYFYVLDDQDRLVGVVPTRRLLLNLPETLIKDIMVDKVIRIPASATVHDALEFFIFHRLLAFPVVDEDNRMLGIVDINLYTEERQDLDRQETNRDVFQLIGVHLKVLQKDSPWIAFLTRVPWLSANIAGGTLAAVLTGMYEEELQNTVALALFVPVVLALAESVAIQSIALSLQLLHSVKPSWRTLCQRLWLEAQTGLLLGVACGATVGLICILWLFQWKVALSLLGGIAGGVTAAALIGITMPNLLRLMKWDPQVASGPVALALTDTVTLLAYFSLARWLLN